MGMLRPYKCGSCGYRAEVSGGDDAGMVVTTTTISCGVCRKLYDVVVRRVDESEPVPKEPKCPQSATHPVSIWKDEGPCPQCGEPLGLDPDGLVTLWD